MIAAFEAWIRRAAEGRAPGAAAPVLVANVGDAGVAELARRLGDWPGRIVATALDGGTAGPSGLGHPDGRGAVRDRRRAGDGDPRTDHGRGARTPRSSGSPGSGPGPSRSRCGCRRPGATTPPTPSGSPGAAAAAGLATGSDRRGPRGVPGCRPAPRAQGRGGRRRGLRRLWPSPHGHPRDAGGGAPAGARPPGLGGLRAAHLPPDGGAARRVRGRPRGRRRGRDRGHLGRAGPGHDHRLRGRPRGGRRGAWRPASRWRRRARVEATASLAGQARFGPATRCW